MRSRHSLGGHAQACSNAAATSGASSGRTVSGVPAAKCTFVTAATLKATEPVVDRWDSMAGKTRVAAVPFGTGRVVAEAEGLADPQHQDGGHLGLSRRRARARGARLPARDNGRGGLRRGVGPANPAGWRAPPARRPPDRAAGVGRELEAARAPAVAEPSQGSGCTRRYGQGGERWR